MYGSPKETRIVSLVSNFLMFISVAPLSHVMIDRKLYPEKPPAGAPFSIDGGSDVRSWAAGSNPGLMLS